MGKSYSQHVRFLIDLLEGMLLSHEFNTEAENDIKAACQALKKITKYL